MSLNLACLNVRGLKDPNKCVHLLGELLKFYVDVTTVQETHFIYAVLENDFVVLSAFGDCH